MLDFKLKKFLINNEVENIDDVWVIHLFGVWYDGTIMHHSVKNFDDFYDYVNDMDYQRIMVIYNNGGSVAWDVDPDMLREGLDNLYNLKTITTINPLIN